MYGLGCKVRFDDLGGVRHGGSAVPGYGYAMGLEGPSEVGGGMRCFDSVGGQLGSGTAHV